MSSFVVLGSQWGDEGKGKVVDLLTERVDIVARYAGGPNAGHTICVGTQRFALHHIPSGILRDSVVCVIGNGVVVDPASLLKEISDLRAAGIRVDDNLRLSDRAHLILPYHRACDIAREEAARSGKLGTTRLGVGPAYESKAGRYGIRVADLDDEAGLVGRCPPSSTRRRSGWRMSSWFTAGRCSRSGPTLRCCSTAGSTRGIPSCAKGRRGRCSIWTMGPIRT